MKIIDNELQFSISDIVQYFKSPYASYATWSNLQNPGHISVENNLIQNSSLQLRSEENEADAKGYLINNYEEVKSITNPLEAVRYNCNILHGPNVSNFNEIYKFLNKQKISKKVINLNQTINILQKLFNSKKSQKNIKDKINKIGQKVLKKNIDEINIILDKI